MQKTGCCGGEKFVPVTLNNQEKPVEEKDEIKRLLANLNSQWP